MDIFCGNRHTKNQFDFLGDYPTCINVTDTHARNPWYKLNYYRGHLGMDVLRT